MQQKGYKRKWRNYFIKHDLQGKHIFLYFMLVIGGALTFVAILALFSVDTMTITYEDYVLRVGSTPLILKEKFFTATPLFILLGGLLLIAVTLLISHRIAGPIYKFEKYVDSMLAGNLGEPLSLRNKDDGKDLAEKLHTLSQKLARTMSEIESLSREIDKEVGASSSFPCADQVLEKNKKIQESLKRFTVR